MLTKNNPSSIFISFACWKTTIGIDIKTTDNKSGIFIKVLDFDLTLTNESETISIITIKLKNHQTEFRKNAWAGSLIINHIHVKTCHEYIHEKRSIIHE